MMSPARAEQRTRFFDTYRSYVINYNLGKDLVKQYIESRAGAPPAKRWQEFVRLLASPRLPSALRAPGQPPVMDPTLQASLGRRAARDLRRDRHLPVRSAAPRPLRSPPPHPRRRLRRRTEPAVFSPPRLRLLRRRPRSVRGRPRSAPRGAARTASAPPITFTPASSIDLPWDAATMDAVICSAVLHFASDVAHFGRMVRGAVAGARAGRDAVRAARVQHRSRSRRSARPAGRVRLPDGSDRFVVDEQMLLEWTDRLGGAAARSAQDHQRAAAALHDDVVCQKTSGSRRRQSPAARRRS